MLDANFNIIKGQRFSGRSSFLFVFGQICSANDQDVIFLGATDEFNHGDFTWTNNPFSLKFFYRHKDHNLIKNIVEIAERDNCGYIFIDDIEFLSRIDIEVLSKSRVKKICTCLDGKIPENLTDFKTFTLLSTYDDDSFKESKSLLLDNGQKILIQDFLKIFDREQKITSILKNEK